MTGSEIVKRARSQLARRVLYKMGAGNERGPSFPHCDSPNQQSDCSGFVVWCCGLGRKTAHNYYLKFGGWVYTTSIWSDGAFEGGLFAPCAPEPGCVIVYPHHGEAPGHCGIVSEVDAAGKVRSVVHCSAGNGRTGRSAIQETGPRVFERWPDTITCMVIPTIL